jgi:pyruvate-formate lyase-activating enzyme
MYRAVFADRSGRVIVSDNAAAAFDGVSTTAFAEPLALPPDALVVPMEREALTLDRAGRSHDAGAGRLAVAALLPPGHLRMQLPAYAEEPGRHDLEPRAYTAVAADERGELVTSAIVLDRDATHDAEAYPKNDIAARVNDALRAQPADPLVRQLARCAREYGCRAAANAFYGRWECALPVAAPANESPVASVRPRLDREAEPKEPAAFHPTADEIADRAVRHVEAGGTILSFGRACEGEPLAAGRLVEEAIQKIRARTKAGTIHLETNGSSPPALRRLATAGLDSLTVRLMSARGDTYERLHRPRDYRWSDVRATLRLAAELRLAVNLLVLALPGLFDRADEIDALVAVASELPEGSGLHVRDLAADPLRALAEAQGGGPIVGMSRAIERVRDELPHLRVGTFVRPLARI